jgi:hypothetical protein
MKKNYFRSEFILENQSHLNDPKTHPWYMMGDRKVSDWSDPKTSSGGKDDGKFSKESSGNALNCPLVGGAYKMAAVKNFLDKLSVDLSEFGIN